MGHKEYFISDTHFSHENVIKFERTQFASIEEHDNYLVRMYKDLAKKVKFGDTVYHLGDWGNVDFLWVNDLLSHQGAKTVLVMGNHDKRSLIDSHYLRYFDEVYEHAFFLTDRILLSHAPYVLQEPGVINVHGHLHGARLNSDHHVVCSVDVIDYTPVKRSEIDKKLGRLPHRNLNFLEESYASMYKFTKKRNNEDAIADSDGNIDILATKTYKRLLEKLKQGVERT